MDITVRYLDAMYFIENLEYYENLPYRPCQTGRNRIKNTWNHMISRCYVHTDYNKSYKKKNIQVCQDWLYSFENFYQWVMKNGYSDNLTIDRIHNDLDYQPNNCRWVTMKQNSLYRGPKSRPEIGY